eukprot:m.43416 g.43416  ORF g.43416 m.43416 type:complete len:93 (-) comp5780_c0_seq3:664-942(-)
MVLAAQSADSSDKEAPDSFEKLMSSNQLGDQLGSTELDDRMIRSVHRHRCLNYATSIAPSISSVAMAWSSWAGSMLAAGCSEAAGTGNTGGR